MKFLLGTKESMIQIYDDKGRAVPATVVKAGPIVVTQIKTKTADGYNGIQVGFGTKKNKNVSKAVRGHVRKVSGENNFAYLREFPVVTEATIGTTIDASIFSEGDTVEVSGISKGKGFQGVVKRHGFHGGPRTHGQKHSEREPGSIGAGGMQRVFKGKRMAGRMGSDRTTVKNLKIVKIDAGANKILISGAIPGRRGTLIEIKAK